jgi:hypothetical protein
MNVPSVKTYRTKHSASATWFAVVNSGAPDRFPGCYWFLYDESGRTISYGESKGWSGDGAGSAISAMRLAMAAARRWDRKGVKQP